MTDTTNILSFLGIPEKEIKNISIEYENEESVAGYQWRKLPKDAPNDDIAPLIKARGTNIKKPVIAINIEAKEEQEFPSILICAHSTHLDPKNVRETIKGNQTQSKGYTFKLKEE